MSDLTSIQMDGLQVMLDPELAHLYGVESKVLNLAVKRNIERFPSEFMFQLAESDMENLRSQFVTLKSGRGHHRKYLHYAFTEQGVAMRRFLQTNAQVYQRLDTLELKQNQTDQKVERVLFAKSKPKVSITICTKTISNQREHDVKKWFVFSKLHINSVDILNKLKKEGVV
ncbi:MAG: ORF6N domain-containing protein [Bacteroidales bacterium]|nr:ORF6N domain-containing protein [Bacteroidales bacterium]